MAQTTGIMNGSQITVMFGDAGATPTYVVVDNVTDLSASIQTDTRDTNFVWWVGIGHAGTLISAVLLLFRQKWRMAINRSAVLQSLFSLCRHHMPMHILR